jgi:hypothetical protein
MTVNFPLFPQHGGVNAARQCFFISSPSCLSTRSRSRRIFSTCFSVFPYGVLASSTLAAGTSMRQGSHENSTLTPRECIPGVGKRWPFPFRNLHEPLPGIYRSAGAQRRGSGQWQCSKMYFKLWVFACRNALVDSPGVAGHWSSFETAPKHPKHLTFLPSHPHRPFIVFSRVKKALICAFWRRRWLLFNLAEQPCRRPASS